MKWIWIICAFVFGQHTLAQEPCKKDYTYPTSPSTEYFISSTEMHYSTHFKNIFYRRVPNLIQGGGFNSKIELKIFGGHICRCQDGDQYLITPTHSYVYLYFLNNLSQDTIDIDTFKVRLAPLHDVKVLFNEQDYSGKTVILDFDHWKTARVEVVWDSVCRRSFPDEFFKYRVTNFSLVLVRNRRPVDKVQVKSNVAEIGEVMLKSEPGDRLNVNAYMMREDENGNLSYMNCGVMFNYDLGQ